MAAALAQRTDELATSEALDAVRAGLPVDALQRVAREAGVTLAQVLLIAGLSDRTYARRKIGLRLTVDESDRVMRLQRLFERSTAILGDQERARRWLNTPNRALNGETPIGLATTETGAVLAFDLLGRIEHGVFS